MAGQDAELQLKVSLDLAFFRQQLSTIGAQLGGQSLQLNVQFNKKSIADQYRLLDRYVRGKKFNVELNLVGGLTKNEFEKIKGRLDDLRELRKIEIPVSIKNGATGKEVQQTIAGIKDRIGSNQQIRQGGGKLRIATSIKPSITNADISDFKRAVREKLSGISVKINAETGTIGGGKIKAQIEKEALAGWERIQQMGAERMGGISESARRESLRQSLGGRDIGELKGIGAQLGVKGVGRFSNTQNLIKKIVSEASIEMITKYLDPQAVMRNPDRSGLNKVLDTFARGLFNMLGMDVASMRQQAAQRRVLPAIDFPAVVPQRNFPIGPSSTGRALPAGRAAAGMIGAAQAPIGLLPSITQRSSTKAGIEVLMAGLKPSPGKLALSATTLRARIDELLSDYLKVAEVTVREVFNPQDLKRALNIFSFLPQALRDAESRTRQARFGLPSAQGLAGLLPAARGRAPSTYATGAIGGESREQMMARRTAEAYARSALRGVSVMSERQTALPGTTFMGDAFVSGGGRDRVTGSGQAPQRGGAIVPYAPSTRLSEGYFEAAKKYSAALEAARATSAKFTASQLPLVGGLREVANEFGFAIKQVVLFGTAYKALAFIQSLPGQVLNAAKSQQQYNNALQTATQDTGTFAKELLYVDNVQRAFGLNLETTRSGFTKLYASMAPTGFDSGSIEKLFTGIGAATAALQLTPDKAERVIYAFGQMASKGQIMSEELKGQLGDVLPGALAIFAKAAGMSVKEFSKAMEDGVFVGGKFREVFAKVSDELMSRFGTGAQAAGKSLQGLLNTVQGDFQRTLESFAPLANAAAQAILGPLGGSLKQLSMSAQIATGEIERTFTQLKEAQKDLGDLRTGGADAKELRAAEQNVAALTARYKTLQQAAQDPAIAKQAQDIQLFTQELAKAGTFVMNTAKAIGSVLSPILNILGTNLTTVISLVTSFYIGFQTARLFAMALMGVLLLYRGLSTLLGFGAAAQQATVLAGAFNILGVSASRAQIQVVGLRLGLTALVATTVVGAVVAGIVAIAGAFATMRDRAQEAGQSSRDAAKSAIEAAQAGGTAQAAMAVQTILTESRTTTAARKTLEAVYARSTKAQRGGIAPMALTDEEVVALRGSALTEGMIKATRGNRREIQVPNKKDYEAVLRQFGSLAGEQKVLLREAKSAQDTAQRVAKEIGLNKPTPGAMPPDVPDEKALERQRKLAEKAAEDARKLADDKAKYESDLTKLSSQQVIALDDLRFEHWKSLEQEKYNILIAGENSWLSQALKFQQQLKDVEINRIEAVRKAREATAKAEVEAGSKAYIAAAGGGMPAGAGGATGLLQGSTGTSSGPHFHVGGARSEDEARAIFATNIRKQLLMTSGYGPRNTGIPGASRFHQGVDLAGPANTPLNLAPGYSLAGAGEAGGLGYAASIRGPQGQMYRVGHLQRPQGGLPPSRQRAEAKKDYNAALASQTALNQKDQESLIIKYKAIEAQAKIAALIKEQVALITPVEEQKLENQILQQRIGLLSSGVFGDRLDTEMKIAEATGKANLNIEEAKKKIEENNATAKEQKWTNEQLTAENKKQLDYIRDQEKALADYLPLLRERLALEQSSAEASLQGAVKRATPLGGMGLAAGFIGESATKYEEAIGRNASEQRAREFAELQNQLTLLETRNNAIKSSILSIGDAFGTAMTTGVASLVSGTATAQEVFASFLQSIGQALLQAASQMIATYIAIGIARIFAGLGSSGAFNGNASIQGGGFGSFSAGVPSVGGVPNLPGLEGAGALTSVSSVPSYAGVMFANGGIARGGFRAFADGGVVSGPTLGLVGEGRYNEAVVPLPDGKSIPVQMQGDSLRDKMGSGTGGMGMPMLSMSFQSTTINGVEYVDRAQLEAAMMETRKMAVREGATRGATIALDKLANSPSSRRRVGLR